MAYQGLVAGVPTWSTGCIATGQGLPCTLGFSFGATCDPAEGTTFTFLTYNTATCSTGTLNAARSWNSITGADDLTLASHDCSPLNLVFTGIFGGTLTL